MYPKVSPAVIPSVRTYTGLPQRLGRLQAYDSEQSARNVSENELRAVIQSIAEIYCSIGITQPRASSRVYTLLAVSDRLWKPSVDPTKSQVIYNDTC